MEVWLRYDLKQYTIYVTFTKRQHEQLVEMGKQGGAEYIVVKLANFKTITYWLRRLVVDRLPVKLLINPKLNVRFVPYSNIQRTGTYL